MNNLTKEVQRAVPAGMDGDRIVRIAITLIRQSDIAKATGTATTSLSECDPQSFAAALLTSSALGLEPGIGGLAYLVPYRNSRARMVECTLIVGYRGHAALAWRHPRVQDFGSGYVLPSDEFDWEDGMDQYLRHKPDLEARANPKAEPVAYYAWGKLAGGGRKIEVMPAEKVREFRRGKVGPQGKDMIDPNHWMERKVPLRQVLKSMPWSVTDWANVVDERTGLELAHMSAPARITTEVGAAEVPDRPMIDQAGDLPVEDAAADDPWVTGEVAQPGSGGPR